MDYKSKIKGFKADVDIEAWQAMEQLLDHKDSDEKAVLVNSYPFGLPYKLWIAIGILIIAILFGLGSMLVKEIKRDKIGENKSSIESEIEKVNNLPSHDSKEFNNDHATKNSKAISSDSKTDKNKNDGLKNTDLNIGKSGIQDSKAALQPENKKEFQQNGSDYNHYSTLTNESKWDGDFTTSMVTLQKSNRGSILDPSTFEESQNKNSDNQRTNSEYSAKQIQSLNSVRNDEDLTGNTSSVTGMNQPGEAYDNIDQSVVKELELIPLRLLLPFSEQNFVELNSVVEFDPINSGSRFLIGLDAGESHYFSRVYGKSISLYGFYEKYWWLRLGARLNHTNMADPTKYAINPEVKDRIRENSLHFIAQITPIQLWKINLGVEGGFGTTWSSDKDRVYENPEPNVITYLEESTNSTSSWFYIGGLLTIDLSRNVEVGVFSSTNVASESIATGGRLIYRFK